MIEIRKQSRRFRFTKKGIDALRTHDPDSPSREMEYSDEGCIGLRALVSKTGRKSFLLRYTIHRRKRSIALGEFPAISVEEARRKANEYKNSIANGIDPQVERDRQRKAATFEEFADEHIEHAKKNKKSWRDDERMLKNQIVPKFGRFMLSAITKRDIQKFLDDIVTRSSGPTANRYRSLILRMMNLAVDWDQLQGNPAKGIRKHKENPAREVFLTEDEVKRLLAALDESKERVSACAVKFLIATGKRLTEAMCLTWDDIDFDNKFAYMHQDLTKGTKRERVFLNDLAVSILKELVEHRMDGNPHVFPGTGKTGRLLSPKRVYNRAKKEAGIDPLTRLHDLRHTFASMLIGKGGNASLYEVQRLLGHNDVSMTQRYAHLSEDVLRERTESVSARFTETVG